MSHARAPVVIGGVVLSAGLFCLGWVLSSHWRVEKVSLRGLPRPAAGERNPELAAPFEFTLQPAQTIFNDAVAAPAQQKPGSFIPTAENSPQPAATAPFPGQQRAKVQAESGSRETKLQLAEPRLVLQGTPAEQLEQLLEQPVTMRVSNATVNDIVAMLRGALPVNVLLDAKSLEDLAYDKKDLLHAASPAPIKLRQALDLLLKGAQLDFIIENDVLLITSHFKAENIPVTKFYDVSDLLRPAGVEHEHENVDFDSLINQISLHVLPPSFSNNNGQPKIFPFENGDLLVIPHSRRGHDEITKLLNELRRGRGLKIPDTLKIVAPAVNLAQQQPAPQPAVKEELPDPDERILRFEFTDEGLNADLLKKMKPAERVEYQLRRRGLLQAQNVTLIDIVQLLRDKLQINILIDKKAMEEAAFDTATPIRYLPNVGTRLSGSLRQLLNELGLSFLRRRRIAPVHDQGGAGK